MNVESIVEDLLNMPKMSKCLDLLKTNNWKKLDVSKKKKVFETINKCFCEYLGLKNNGIVVREDPLKKEIFGENADYHALEMSMYDDEIIINDINNNQYTILYEYFYNIRLIMQDIILSDEETTNMSKDFFGWKKDKDFIAFGDINIEAFNYDGNFIAKCQNTELDAIKFSEVIIEKIMSRNSIENGYDEESFLSNCDVFVSDELINIGKKFDRAIKNTYFFYKDRLRTVNEIINKASENVSKLSNEYIYMFIYPDIACNVNPELLVKVYNQLSNIIYGDFIDIKLNRNKILVKDVQYTIKEFANRGFNILVYEILKDMDNEMRKDEKFFNSELVKNVGLETAIIEKKKKYLFKVISEIDSRLMGFEFGIINYLPLKYLLNIKNLDNIIKSTMFEDKIEKKGRL